jgi:SAM-dependent methyltransferase
MNRHWGRIRAMSDRGVIETAIVEDSVDDLWFNRVQETLTQGRVQEGLDELVNGLQTRRESYSDERWHEIIRMGQTHDLKDLLHQDPFTHRAFAKPKGYAGDAVLIDYLYGREEHWPLPEWTTDLGRRIFDYTSGSPAAEGVRARRRYVARLLDRLVEEVDRPHVLSIAAGHLREAMLSSAIHERKLGRLVALDADRESLGEITRSYGYHGVEVVHAGFDALISKQVRPGDFDLVYSTGLFDYLPKNTAQRLTLAMFDLLRPRGRLVVSNLLPGIRELGYMECFMGWKLICRSRPELLEVSALIPHAEIGERQIFTEESENIIFLEITKR